MNAIGSLAVGKVIAGLVIGGLLAYDVLRRFDMETGSENKGGRVEPMLWTLLLPGFIILITFVALLADPGRVVMHMIMPTLSAFFVMISVYYALLMAVLPVLRRRISARACAMLWLMPNMLYIFFRFQGAVMDERMIFFVNERIVYLIFIVWLAGFIAVEGYYLLQHFFFRRHVLKGTYAVDENTAAVFNKAKRKLHIYRPMADPLISPAVVSPLTVGLRRSSLRVLLPEKEYSNEELYMIFRHELVHICRQDHLVKFYMLFCKALCWINPLMWMAMRKSAEDMELSCDETVLMNADDETRRLYADLLLTQTADIRGFTTCLSAKAESFRYRLLSVLEGEKRHSGALAVFVTGFVMTMLMVVPVFAVNRTTGREVIFQGNDVKGCTVVDCSVWENMNVQDIDVTTVYCRDPEGMMTYLSEMELYELTGIFDFDETEMLSMDLVLPDDHIFIYQQGCKLRVYSMNKDMTGYYIVKDEAETAGISDYLFAGIRLNVYYELDNGKVMDCATLLKALEVKDGKAEPFFVQNREDVLESFSVSETDTLKVFFSDYKQAAPMHISVTYADGTEESYDQIDHETPLEFKVKDQDLIMQIDADVYSQDESTVYRLEYVYDLRRAVPDEE